MTNRRTLVLVTGVGIAAAGAGFLAARFVPSSAPTAAAPAAVEAPLPTEVTLAPQAAQNFGIKIVKAELHPLQRTIRVTGTVGFNELRLAHINPLARGRIQVMEVVIGQRVKAGQRLAVLDALDLAEARHQLASAQAAVRQADAEILTSRAALQRAQELVRIGAVAQSELERRRADMARVEAAQQTRMVEAEHWREMLARYSPTAPGGDGPDAVSLPGRTPEDARGAILAPFDGAVLSIGATPGELVDTNRELFALADLSTMWVQADVPERDLAAVRPGADVAIAVEAYPGRRFPGRVAYVADQLDPRTGTAKVRCEIPNPDAALKANMFVVAEISAPLGRDGIVVPEAAIQSIDGQPAVFVRLAGDRYGRRDIRPGLRQGALTEVAEGIAAGDVVVAEGSFRLKALLLQSRMPEGD